MDSISTSAIIGWNILPEEIKSIKLKQLVDLSQKFDRLISDIVLSEYEKALVRKQQSLLLKQTSTPTSAAAATQRSSFDQSWVKYDPISWAKKETLDWGTDELEQSSNKKVEEELDWGNEPDNSSQGTSDKRKQSNESNGWTSKW